MTSATAAEALRKAARNWALVAAVLLGAALYDHTRDRKQTS